MNRRSKNGRATVAQWAIGVVLLVLAAALARLHAGSWWLAHPRPARWLEAVVAIAAYAAWCAWLLRRHRHRTTAPLPDAARQRSPVADPARVAAPTSGEASAVASAVASAAPAISNDVLVVWASQTGYASELAQLTAATLAGSGVPFRVLPIDAVDASVLSAVSRALFIASTTGEGDPPDHAVGFLRSLPAGPQALAHLHYAVLALGDREYEDFCAYGHALDDGLRTHGARPLFDLVEVDNADGAALRHWQHHLGSVGVSHDTPDWQPAAYDAWTLLSRTHLNPGSAGGAAYDLALRPVAGALPAWRAGDIAEVGPRNAADTVHRTLAVAGLGPDAIASQGETWASFLSRSHLPAAGAMSAPAPGAAGTDLAGQLLALPPLPHREYSIASSHAEGALRLLVRLARDADGRSGIGSGWLCEHAVPGSEIALRIRSNPNFHGPAASRPLVLIGNGTGLAGLRAHLQERIAAGARRNWLVFGERNRAHDYFHGADIDAWNAGGWLERCDLVFSRDGSDGRREYVQDRLRAESATLRAWVEEGAALFVCGSLEGMAPGVDSVLRQVLGDAQVEALLAAGRYRRDVY